MSYPKLTPITAKGATEPRYLEDRFADVISVKDFGAKGDGITDDTTAIKAALNSSHKTILFPSGLYLISSEDNSSDPVFTSSVNDRKLIGSGIITANTQVKVLFRITGKNSVISLHIDGNNYIGYAITCAGENITVRDCNIHDLNGLDNWGGIAIRYYLEDLDTTATIINNSIKNIHGVGDNGSVMGVGMNRAIIVQSNQNCTKQILIQGNNIECVDGEEGDAICLISIQNNVFYDFPALISGNTVNGWTRRCIKIQCNNVSIIGNRFSNKLDSALSQLQRAIDIVEGSSISIIGNTFDSCLFQPQIGIWVDENRPSSNITICNNVFLGLGAETTANIINGNYVNKLIVSNNTILCPTYTANLCTVLRSNEFVFSRNIISYLGGTNIGTLTSTTNVTIDENIFLDGTGVYGIISKKPYPNDTEGVVIDVNGVSKVVTLYNKYPSVYNEATVAGIQCKQNDTSNPNTVTAAINFIGDGTQGALGIGLCTSKNVDNGLELDEKIRLSIAGHFRPCYDGEQYLGMPAYQWAHVYASTGIVETSDARLKNNITNLDEKLMNAWGNVHFKVFQLIDSINKKGSNARLHVGVIAQDVQKAFEDFGLDASRYGLFCYDEWDDEYKETLVIDKPAEYGENGKEISPEQTHVEREKILSAGNKYSIRYEEALALECAYQRWRLEQLEKRIDQLINPNN